MQLTVQDEREYLLYFNYLNYQGVEKLKLFVMFPETNSERQGLNNYSLILFLSPPSLSLLFVFMYVYMYIWIIILL